jgi:hypothetical protein
MHTNKFTLRLRSQETLAALRVTISFHPEFVETTHVSLSAANKVSEVEDCSLLTLLTTPFGSSVNPVFGSIPPRHFVNIIFFVIITPPASSL